MAWCASSAASASANLPATATSAGFVNQWVYSCRNVEIFGVGAARFFYLPLMLGIMGMPVTPLPRKEHP